MARAPKKVVPPKKIKRSTAHVIMTCRDHEDYKAIYPPKVDCLICWKIYATRLRLKIKEFKMKELKMMLKAPKNV